MISNDAYIAGTRFGLGIRYDEVRRISASPMGWLTEQIRSPLILSNAFASLLSTEQNLKSAFALRQARADANDKVAAQQKIQESYKDIFVGEMRAKLLHAITTTTPFYERLADFWSNHFAVSVKKGQVQPIAGSYEREAIRPYVTGRFADMLLAVAHHPAMLIYLDNAGSICPDSIAGRRRDKGLNENLAREIMELHTLGVDGGYTQTDVTTFAKVLTGWSLTGPNTDDPGHFDFTPRRHEPGTQTILDKSYPDDGEDQGIAVLRNLAVHPATAHHIATKLARHFIADTPPDSAVERLAEVFSGTGGDLPSVYRALVEIPEAWDVRHHTKIKSSYDLVVSAARAAGKSEDEHIDYCLKSLRFLGDMPFTADSPAGLPDVARDMVGPEAMIRRVEWAQMAAKKLEPSQSATEMVSFTIGPVMREATQHAIAHAQREPEAVALLFGSPEFQRR